MNRGRGMIFMTTYQHIEMPDVSISKQYFFFLLFFYLQDAGNLHMNLKFKFFKKFICSLRQSILPHLMISAGAEIFSPLISSSLQSSIPFGAFCSFSVWADSYFPKTNGFKVKSCGLLPLLSFQDRGGLKFMEFLGTAWLTLLP